MSKSSLQKKFPIFKIKDNNTIISKRADYSFAYEISMPEIFTLSEEDYKDINTLFLGLVKRMPAYSVIHKQDIFHTEKYKPRPDENPSVLGKYSEHKFLEREHVHHKCIITFIKTNKHVTKRATSTNILNTNLIGSDQLDMRKYEEFYSTVKSIEESLKRSPFIKIRALDKNELLNTVYPNYLNLGLNSTMVDIDFSNGMQVGNKFCSYYTMENLTDFCDSVSYKRKSEKFNTFFSFPYSIGLGLKFDHIYNQYVFIDNSKAVLEDKEVTRNYLSSFSQASSVNAYNRDKMDEFIAEINSGALPVRFHANILTFSKSVDILADNSFIVEDALQNLGFKPRLNKVDAPELYWAGIIGNGSDVPAHLTPLILADQAVCLFNCETNYKDSNSDFGIKLTDRETGFPIHFDPIFAAHKEKLINNRNMFVIGPSGSGKSFFTNKMVRHLLDQGHHLVIVDMGYSYKRICQLYNGVHIDFSENEPLSFNPFKLNTGQKITDEKIENISALIFTLWMEKEATKTQEAILRELITDYYKVLERKTEIFPCFDTFYEFVIMNYEFVKNKEDSLDKEELNYFDYANFKITLRQYYKDGAYGFLLNSKKEWDLLNNQLVVFELENIKNNQTLLQIETLMIMDTYLNKVFKLEGEKILKSLLMEEAWKALMNPKMAEFLKYAAKTVRKHYGQLITVTQELDDLLGNEIVKSTIVGNSDIKVMLDQSSYKDQFLQVKDLVGLTNQEADLVLSLNKNIDSKRNLKEVWIKTGPISKVFGVEVSDAEYATFTTNKDEVQIIEALEKERGGDLEMAILQFAEDKRNKLI